jgi:hypothetical protein
MPITDALQQNHSRPTKKVAVSGRQWTSTTPASRAANFSSRHVNAILVCAHDVITTTLIEKTDEAATSTQAVVITVCFSAP